MPELYKRLSAIRLKAIVNTYLSGVLEAKPITIAIIEKGG